MARFRRAGRWAAAGLLAYAGLAGQGWLQAQDGVLLPPIGSTSPQPRLVRGAAPTSPTPTPFELILDSAPQAPAKVPAAAPPAAPLHMPAPDDGLGARMIPPATPPAQGAAPACGQPGCPCGDGGPKDRFAKVPPVAVLPRAGFFPILPTGPGYYTLSEFLQDEPREGPPKYPYPRISPIFSPLFDIDWRYLDDPKNTETDFWDFLKRRRFGPDDLFMITFGGEIRARYNYEGNSRLTGRDNNYDLYRVLAFADLYITERFRVFAEFLSATSPDYLLTPQLVDRDPADFLDLFIDANLLDVCHTPLWLRVGRQELLYGSQRLISPPDWNNTRRTFDGVKMFWHGEKDDIDLFFVQPVVPDKGKFDSVDNNIVFGGIWYTHRPKPGSAVDAYYLVYDNTNRTFTGRFGAKGGTTVHTFGTRWVGDKDNWLWDVEGMVQCGEFVNQGLFARAFTLSGGYHFKDWCATPTFWVCYDFASGTPDPGQGSLNQTFNQLFPFGHYYLGWLDLVGRKNINDVNCELTLYPAKWLFTQLQCHNFWLDSAKDALYAPNNAVLRQDKTGNAGNYVGTEFDFIVNFHLTNHSDILLAYGYMFAGRFLTQTAKDAGQKQNPDAAWVQYSYRW
jgi:hypothetical protein